MTTKEKIKAFINENAKYKVGQTVYWSWLGGICRAIITEVGINDDYWDFFYYGGPYNAPLGPESDLYSSYRAARDACCEVMDYKLANLSSAAENEVECEDKYGNENE